MNFTREPIIETIISPKEGCKLLVRNSKGGSSDEYYVDAVEVVSFGHSFFFRCLERPKSFLVPVSDYEIMEVKEARVALKNVSHERSIKIGGGRDAPVRPTREQPQEKESEVEEEGAEEEASEQQQPESRPDRRRDRRRRRHRRSSDEGGEWQERRPHEQSMVQREKEPEAPKMEGEGGGAADEAKVSSTMFSTLFSPPPTLISETISRYKDKEFADAAFFSKPVGEKFDEPAIVESEEAPAEKPGEDIGSDSAPLHRVTSSSTYEETTVTSTFFSPLSGGFSNDFPYRG